MVVLYAGSRLLSETQRAAFSAALARSGAVEVGSFGELFSAVESLSARRLPRGDRLAVVTNGPGLALLAADACALHRVTMAAGADGADGARQHDLGEAVSADDFAEAAATLAAAATSDAVLALFSPTRIAGAEAVAAALLARSTQASPLLCCLVGGDDAARGRALLQQQGWVVFDTPDAAVRGFAVLVEYQRNQRRLLEAPRQEPQSRPLDEASIDQLLAQAAAARQASLNDSQTHRLLEACGIPAADTYYTADIDTAAAWARRNGYPVRLAALPRPDEPTDAAANNPPARVAEERVDIRSERELRGAAAALRGRWLERYPKSRFAGYRLRRMLDGRDTLALRLGLETDPAFGPVLRFGAGGRAARLAPELATALPPLTRQLAVDLIADSPVAAFLTDENALDSVYPRLIDTLLAVSALAVRYPAIPTLTIDPLYADLRGLTAVSARVTIDPSNPQPDLRHGHLAIHPYPVELEQRVTLRAGQTVYIRPIKPDDASRLTAAFAALSEQTRLWRFLHPIKMLTPPMVARFTQVDYERDLALVGVSLAKGSKVPTATDPIIGVARYVREADKRMAEFAIVVDDAWQGSGLARVLLEEIIAHASRVGLQRLTGMVHRDNLRMLSFVQRRGFRLDHSTSEPTLQVARLDLKQPTEPSEAQDSGAN